MPTTSKIENPGPSSNLASTMAEAPLSTNETSPAKNLLTEISESEKIPQKEHLLEVENLKMSRNHLPGPAELHLCLVHQPLSLKGLK